MTLHLRVLDGEEQKIIEELRCFCGENIKVVNYTNFYDIHICTKYESGFSALFSEKHYLDGDYRLLLFKREDHTKEVSIPLKFIDCIYSLWLITTKERKNVALAIGGTSLIASAKRNTLSVKERTRKDEWYFEWSITILYW